MGVIFLLEAMVGASLAPLFPGDAYGRHSPHWRRYGGLLDRMMATSTSSPRGGIIFGDSLAGRTRGRLGGWASVSACFSLGDQGGATCHLPSITMRLGSMVHRSLGGRRVMMGM
jgi:hypothetical protein